MNKFTKQLVDKYANELLIGLSEEENENVLSEFEVIDRTCEIVSLIPGIEKVEPMTHCLDETVVDLREDTCEESINVDDALKNSDKVFAREVELPKVVG